MAPTTIDQMAFFQDHDFDFDSFISARVQHHFDEALKLPAQKDSLEVGGPKARAQFDFSIAPLNTTPQNATGESSQKQAPPPLPPRPQLKSLTALVQEQMETSSDDHSMGDLEEYVSAWLENPINQRAVAEAPVPSPTPFTKWYTIKLEAAKRYPDAQALFDLDERGEFFRNPFLEDRASVYFECEEEQSPLSGDFEDGFKLLPGFTEGWDVVECDDWSEDDGGELQADGNEEQPLSDVL